ncbi:hypothetical protein JCM10212_001192 [Sporobolomyces blumeae]
MDAFLSKHHVLFSLRHAKYLPTPYQAEDANRMTLAYFCLSSLALLPDPSTRSSPSPGSDPEPDSSRFHSSLDTMLRDVQRQGFVDWVYEQQVEAGGFRGSDSVSAAFIQPSASVAATLDPPNIIQSYTALLNLALLDDDLSRLNRAGLARFVGECQCDDGSFSLFPGSFEPGDPRSTYSAFAVVSMLDDWSHIDVDRALDFLNSCRRYEGGFAQRPGAEANAGPTYCAVASFHLSGRLSHLPDPSLLLRWLVDRQVRPPSTSSLGLESPSTSDDDGDDDDGGEEPDEDENGGSARGGPRIVKLDETAGFQGRANKPVDACYSFWNLAAIRLLSPSLFPTVVDASLNSHFLLHCQHPQFGGIARDPPFVDVPVPTREPASNPPSSSRRADDNVDDDDATGENASTSVIDEDERKTSRARTKRVATGSKPDVYHTYLSLASLAIGNEARPEPGRRDLDRREQVEDGSRTSRAQEPMEGRGSEERNDPVDVERDREGEDRGDGAPRIDLGPLDVAWNVEQGVAERLRRRIRALREQDLRGEEN